MEETATYSSILAEILKHISMSSGRRFMTSNSSKVFVKDVLKRTTSRLDFVLPTASVNYARKKMTAKNSNILYVTNGKQLLGSVSDANFLKNFEQLKENSGLQVKEIMTPDPVTISTESLVEDCIPLLLDHSGRVRDLAVEDEAGGIVGSICAFAVLHGLKTSKENVSEELESLESELRDITSQVVS